MKKLKCWGDEKPSQIKIFKKSKPIILNEREFKKKIKKLPKIKI